MKTNDTPDVVPENIEGKLVDLETSVKEDSVEEAQNTFNRACTRLLISAPMKAEDGRRPWNGAWERAWKRTWVG